MCSEKTKVDLFEREFSLSNIEGICDGVGLRRD